ncbi:MAG: hypothetical protein ABI905_00750 [Betaproteobacteria bacterium]
MRGNQQDIIERQGFFDDFHVYDSDKIGIIRESPGTAAQCTDAQIRAVGICLKKRRTMVTSGSLSIDAMGICDYLSEIRRSFRANPLTTNTLFTDLPVCRTNTKSPNVRKARIAAVTVGWLVLISACTAPELPKPEPVAPVVVVPPPKPTSLTEEADSALKAAEQSVIEARAKRSVWTAAVEHLDKARAAAKNFDSKGTLEHAKEVVALCTLSIQQTLLPPVKW